MSGREIAIERLELEKARRDEVRRKMDEYDAGHQAALSALRTRCGDETQHNFQFSNIATNGAIWSHCTFCGAPKVELRDS